MPLWAPSPDPSLCPLLEGRHKFSSCISHKAFMFTENEPGAHIAPVVFAAVTN